MTNKKQDKIYEPPKVTSVDFMVENGLAGSPVEQTFFLGFNSSDGNDQVESRTDGGSWLGDENSGWF